jgi:cytoskeletal protein CcmA (bactofilin family)
MFKNDKETLHHETETVIAPSVRVEGDFVSDGNVRIEGSVSGSVATQQDLLVGEHAQITAHVTAKNGIFAGELRGNLKVHERLELTETARVYGDIQAKTLTVAPGAIMHGKVTIGVESVEDASKETAETKAAVRPRTVREKKIEEILQQQ